MSLTPWLPTVRKIKDGESVDQSTVNVPIDQLTQREQHLYEKFEALSGKSVLTSFGQPIHPKEQLTAGALNLVYFKSDAYGAGLARGTTGFSSSSSSAMFRPNNSNYTFGLIKTVYPQSKTADVYTEGLCELSVDLNDPVLGLIPPKDDGTAANFVVGPYYLSAKVPGKITTDPSGVPVYVGYALNKRQFLLHTNVDEFSQFFINYRYHILDRVAGRTALDGTTWSITNADNTKLGWLPASAATQGKPDGAHFYYNIPGITKIALDAGLDSYTLNPGTPAAQLVEFEKDEALELLGNLPPIPANFVQLYVDGVLVRYTDIYDTGGWYSINEYGLWWHSNQEGQQPWASNYLSSYRPESWATITKPNVTRKNIFISFARFNPALRTQLVTSLTSFNSATNKAANFINFYKSEGQIGHTGDLLVDVDPKINTKGISDNSAFQYPVAVSPDYTANTAIAALAYSKPDGEFKAALTPVVAKVIQGAGINITGGETTGVWTISNTFAGTSTGSVDSIEPLNTRLEFVGLSSYLKLPVPSNTPYGIVGKIILPRGYASNKPLRLTFHLFGAASVDLGSSLRKVAFKFDYSTVSASNGAAPTNNIIVGSSPEKAAVTAEFSLAEGTAAYVAYTSIKVTHNLLVVPAEYITEDTVVNFRIYRVDTVGTTADTYGGNVGILGTYWEIV